jgi:hypothetical protein
MTELSPEEIRQLAEAQLRKVEDTGERVDSVVALINQVRREGLDHFEHYIRKVLGA